MTATREQIVHHFLRINPTDIVRYNWGCTDHHNTKLWDVDDDTYINGVPLTVDRDLDVGHLLEIVEKDTSAVSYVVVAVTPNGHQSAWWEPDAGTFFHRNVDTETVTAWAVGVIYGLFQHLRETADTGSRGAE